MPRNQPDRRARTSAAPLLAVLLAASGAPSRAQNEEPGSGVPDRSREGADVLRFREDDQHVYLETATVQLHNDAGQRVSLVGAIHIADPGYFESLNREFAAYDAVLYELVGDPSALAAPARPAAAADNPVRFFQVFLKNLLGLEFQIDGIDYGAANFVHADMSESEFDDSMRERGESLQTVFEKALAAQIDAAKEDQGGAAGWASLFGMFDPEVGAPELKIALARALAGFEPLIEKIEAGGGTVVIGARNRVAADKALAALAGGHRDIAVFFGAAHLAGIEEVLVRDHGFRRRGLTWNTAWKIAKPANGENGTSGEARDPAENGTTPPPPKKAA